MGGAVCRKAMPKAQPLIQKLETCFAENNYPFCQQFLAKGEGTHCKCAPARVKDY
jgi:hypothetical protein